VDARTLAQGSSLAARRIAPAAHLGLAKGRDLCRPVRRDRRISVQPPSYVDSCRRLSGGWGASIQSGEIPVAGEANERSGHGRGTSAKKSRCYAKVGRLPLCATPYTERDDGNLSRPGCGPTLILA